MELTFDPVGGAWLSYVVAALLLAAPWVVPPRAVGLAPGRRRTLQVLRTLATLALLFAWARPTLMRVKTETLRPSLVLLLDDSRSMSVADALDGASRWDATRRLLEASRSALVRLGEQQDVRGFLFDRGLTPLTLEGGEFRLPAEPIGDETAIGAALSDALDAARGDGGDVLSGVIVVSDGAQRARPPRDAAPLAAVSRLVAEGAPFYAVPVGDRATGDRADVAIDDLMVSDAAFAGAPLDVGATLRVAGFPNRTVRVRLLWENSDGALDPVDAAQIVVRQGVDAYPIALRYAPPAAGEWKLSVAADTLEGETLADNNVASTFVTVREGGIRVLYLAGATRTGGAPGIEQRFIRSSLAASPDIVVERIAINYREPRLDLTARLKRGAVDVVFVDNVDAEGLSRATWRTLGSLIESGVGMAMIGGRQSFGPGGHRDTLGDVLPITPGRAERQALDAAMREDVHLPGPLRMIPTGRHPITELGSGRAGADFWAELPPLDGANRLGADLKPNAQVIAATDGPRPQPLLVIGQPGLGRVLAFAGDTSWRWVLGGHREAHQRFWRQAVLWLAKKDDDPGATVYIDLASRRVPAGSRLDLVAGVRAADEGAADPIRYEATVTRPDGRPVGLPLPGGGLRAAGVFTDTAEPGDYRVQVTASRGDAKIGDAQSRFHVPRRDLELERPGAEPDTLARLAQATEADGGRTLALEELPTLLAELAAKSPEERREVVARTTLYDKWPLLLVFAGLITTEWLLRRQAGMP
ncbi:hypothetical protein Pla108_25690 [Botrimarina colliarenosi]|uniref:Glutamine amidotransferase domain-containing protein n=1 Tax=Botrimarina colliarenosi TaxID=2528001 RepID=A0A5C6ACC3_9BACT|nr:glutamine amidotransferase [Botrimarina colliarenosi]TWT96795.1 hypothetical protein Pla108_25690 [Botrimarina colliarenosi]